MCPRSEEIDLLPVGTNFFDTLGYSLVGLKPLIHREHISAKPVLILEYFATSWENEEPSRKEVERDRISSICGA